jgi:hypothetical protein
MINKGLISQPVISQPVIDGAVIDSDGWPEFRFACNGGGGCVIVERIAGAVVIRDSKNLTQPGLVFSRKEYADFRRRVQDGSTRKVVLRFAASLLRVLAAAGRFITG